MPKGIKGFQKGQVSWNKGKHIFHSGSFKKGHKFIKGGEKGWFKKGHINSNELIKKHRMAMLGKPSYAWKGGRFITNAGYVLIYKPEHPFCNNNGYIREHRLIMEKILGRYLKKEEGIHHKNGIRNDNRPKNLSLFVSNKNWHPCLCPKCGFKFLIK